MNHGRIEQHDTAFALYRRPARRFVADFIGKSNIFEGTLARSAGGGLDFQAEEFTVPVASPDRAEGRAGLMLRPEDLQLETAAPMRSTKFAPSASCCW